MAISILLLVIWAATGMVYFWPMWPIGGMAVAAFWGVFQLAVLGWGARTVRVGTLVLVMGVAFYASGAVAISGYPCDLYDRALAGWARTEIDMPNHSGQGRTKERRR